MLMCHYREKTYFGLWAVIKAHLRWFSDFPLWSDHFRTRR